MQSPVLEGQEKELSVIDSLEINGQNWKDERGEIEKAGKRERRARGGVQKMQKGILNSSLCSL